MLRRLKRLFQRRKETKTVMPIQIDPELLKDSGLVLEQLRNAPVFSCMDGYVLAQRFSAHALVQGDRAHERLLRALSFLRKCGVISWGGNLGDGVHFDRNRLVLPVVLSEGE